MGSPRFDWGGRGGKPFPISHVPRAQQNPSSRFSSMPTGPDAWAADEKTEASNLPPLPCRPASSYFTERDRGSGP